MSTLENTTPVRPPPRPPQIGIAVYTARLWEQIWDPASLFQEGPNVAWSF